MILYRLEDPSTNLFGSMVIFRECKAQPNINVIFEIFDRHYASLHLVTSLTDALEARAPILPQMGTDFIEKKVAFLSQRLIHLVISTYDCVELFELLLNISHDGAPVAQRMGELTDVSTYPGRARCRFASASRLRGA